MTYITTRARAASRIGKPFIPGQRHRCVDFARQATIDVFGWRYARALDQGDFVDRAPGQLPLTAPEARF